MFCLWYIFLFLDLVMAGITTNVNSSNSDDSGATKKVKVICLGDSAVGKSKLIERFLMDGFKPQQLSTFALTLFTYSTKIDDQDVDVEFWDTAGQERFSNLHPSYYHSAHSCILTFDCTRKITYKNLTNWYTELRQYRPDIPCILVANKIDMDSNITKKQFNFPIKHCMPIYFVSASNGANVVKAFREAIKLALHYKENSTDFVDEVLKELDEFDNLGLDIEKT